MAIPFVDLKTQHARIASEVDRRIQDVLTHGKYILGPEVAEFEKRLADFCGARHALGVSNGTDALQMLLMAKEIGPGAAVFVPSFTFTATAEVILLLGATPVFVEVDERTFNIDPADLGAKIAATRAAGLLEPRAIIAVDLFGLPADYEALMPIAEQENLFLLADSAQSIGGGLGNRRVGALGHATATSFFPAKPLGCYGDGGGILTDDEALYEVCRSIRVHGQGTAKYDVVRIGVNGRLDTMQAAILLAKLDIFADELDRREAVALEYDRWLSGTLQTPLRPAGYRSAWAQYTVLVDDREALQKSLAEQGVPSAVYYPRPMHLQPAYRDYGDGEGSLPVSERLSERVLSLPMHPYLESADIERICDLLLQGVRKAA
ncbi:DegT/DnrJ/EryC1/StrS family aminotransferase [Oceanibacterium hippocampi]|uniref:UDP-2-acetamido-2-deoxy-3-oxo-D-glucuronate aminotransferase n=1 Tax=Oceanibacterium hippocampi TaxID=745714 RepID=A0A1Y5RRY0_9PROT|nr:DegT/DnrJ/EryC1/StrS aminotransferase family protein [Oceanibacterium hippocampi]SLN22826.1 UDP-2-acetamido-2-deoxy-3-oxo-D-glucuronate aminotransferase [Oceanibacterium hippocampi]